MQVFQGMQRSTQLLIHSYKRSAREAADQLLICLLFQPDIIVVCTVSIYVYWIRTLIAVNCCSWSRWQHNNYHYSISKRTPSKSSHTRMINLAAVNVLICLFGYPQSFSLSIVLQETLDNIQMEIFASGLRL